MRPILAALLVLATCSALAGADVLYPSAVVLEPGYASGPPPGFPDWGSVDYGDPLVIAARVASLGEPFQDLVPAGPHEITCYFGGATCTAFGQWDDLPCAGGDFGMFQGGTVAFYLDTTPDADFTNPLTFLDGELVLLATLELVSVLDADPQEACPPRDDEPDVTAYLSFIGGTWFHRVSTNGAGWPGWSRGELEHDVPDALQALGYIFRVDGVFSVQGPVATEPTTWGRVKALYR